MTDEETEECEFCEGTGFVRVDGVDSNGNVERLVDEQKCICQLDD